METKNFLAELNKLNSELGVNSVSGNKYDYQNCNVSKKEETTFRKKMRSTVKSFYASDKLDLNFLKSFVSVQSNALLACTKEKRSFQSLNITEIYPQFDKLSDAEKKQIIERHKKVLSLLYPKAKDENKPKKDVKIDAKKETNKTE